MDKDDGSDKMGVVNGILYFVSCSEKNNFENGERKLSVGISFNV